VSWVAPARGKRGPGATRHVGRGGDPRGPRVPAAAGLSGGPEVHRAGRGGDPRGPRVPAGAGWGGGPEVHRAGHVHRPLRIAERIGSSRVGGRGAGPRAGRHVVTSVVLGQATPAHPVADVTSRVRLGILHPVNSPSSELPIPEARGGRATAHQQEQLEPLPDVLAAVRQVDVEQQQWPSARKPTACAAAGPDASDSLSARIPGATRRPPVTDRPAIPASHHRTAPVAAGHDQGFAVHLHRRHRGDWAGAEAEAQRGVPAQPGGALACEQNPGGGARPPRRTRRSPRCSTRHHPRPQAAMLDTTAGAASQVLAEPTVDDANRSVQGADW
jgi:hypothetical protein